MRHAWLRALGAEEMPAAFELNGQRYEHLRTYKHDFFAATGLYGGPVGKVVLKLGRRVPMLGVPTAWLGRRLAEREQRIYERVADVAGVPACLGVWSRTGFVHAFVEGHPLQRDEWVADDFFDRLEAMIAGLHARDVAYVDLEKRENILVDAEGRPALIDFQISFCWPAVGRRGWQRCVPGPLGRLILRRLQAADRYHLLKHRRRHRPDQLTAEQHAASYRRGFWVELHRRMFWPFTAVRRMILKRLTGRSRSAKQDGPEFM